MGSSKNSLGLYKTDESRRLGSGRQGSTAPTSDPRGPAPAMPTATAIPTGDPRGPPPPLPLPAGWFAGEFLKHMSCDFYVHMCVCVCCVSPLSLSLSLSHSLSLARERALCGGLGPKRKGLAVHVRMRACR